MRAAQGWTGISAAEEEAPTGLFAAQFQTIGWGEPLAQDGWESDASGALVCWLPPRTSVVVSSVLEQTIMNCFESRAMMFHVKRAVGVSKN